VLEREGDRAECDRRVTSRIARSIQLIADDGVADLRELRPDLMLSPSFKLYFEDALTVFLQARLIYKTRTFEIGTRRSA
jgi:hypothetical protein